MKNWIAPTVAAALAFAVGWLLRPTWDGRAADTDDAPVSEAPAAGATEPGVTGIGGVFFTSADPGSLMSWYREHLDVIPTALGVVAFQWKEASRPDEIGYTVWAAFPDTTAYFGPSAHPYMFNYRVNDLRALLAELRAEGVEVVRELEVHPNGSFAWILDPEGRKIELWEPVPSSTDPYLREGR